MIKYILALTTLCFVLNTGCTKKEKTLTAETKVETEVKTAETSKAEADPAEVKKEETSSATIKIKKKEPKKMSTENIWNIKLKDGLVKIKLRPDIAPNHVERIKTLTKQGFYNNLKFHRVIAGFMAQTGDPKGTGAGGSSLPDLQSEFSSTPFKKGVVGMARAASPHSANSQFFIMLEEGSFLNGKYTVFGEVISGMEHVDKIKKGDGPNGAVSEPDLMLEVTLGG